MEGAKAEKRDVFARGIEPDGEGLVNSDPYGDEQTSRAIKGVRLPSCCLSLERPRKDATIRTESVRTEARTIRMTVITTAATGEPFVGWATGSEDGDCENAVCRSTVSEVSETSGPTATIELVGGEVDVR